MKIPPVFSRKAASPNNGAEQCGCPGWPLLKKLWEQLTMPLSRCFGGVGIDIESDGDVKSESDGDIDSESDDDVDSDVDDEWSQKSLDSEMASSPLLPDYDVEGVLGAGSFGFVVAGRKTRGAGAGDQVVAIKVLEKNELVAQKGGVQRLRAEKEALQIIKSPFVAQLLETWQDTSHVFVATKLMSGGDLEGRLKTSPNKGFPASHVRFYTANIVEALEGIHAMGFAHRDLKPANILIDERGYLQVADLGVSKRIHAQKTETYVGTPIYMAPEVLAGIGYGQAVDIWSLGVIMFEMAKGRTPFEDCPATMASRRRPLSFSGDNDLVEDVIAKAMTFDPDERVINVGVGGGARFAVLRSHSWFLEFDWEELRANRLLAPWVPDGSSRPFEDADLWEGEDFDDPYTGEQAIFEGF